MRIFNIKYNNLIIFFCLLFMINGCNNTTQKLIVKDKTLNKISNENEKRVNNKYFVKNKIIKSEIISNNTKSSIKQSNDVIFEFRNERLLQGRNKSDFKDKKITNKALFAVFKMLKQNLSSNNNQLNLKNSDKNFLEKNYFDINKTSTIHKNILVFLPLSGSYSNYGTKIRKALDMSVIKFSNDNVKMIYFDTDKDINIKKITDIFDNLNPHLIIGPFRREILIKIKPFAKNRSIPILTFSNDIAIIENNVWSLGFSPEEQVESVISCALSHGYKNFGLIAPDNLYGRIIINASVELISDKKINNYDKIFLSNEQLNKKTKLFSILKKFLQYTENQSTHSKFDAILISGSKSFILEVAPLLALFNVDSKQVKILGTEKFNIKEIKNEPSLKQAWYPVIVNKNDNEFKLIWKEIWEENTNYFSNAGFESGIIGINYLNKKNISLNFLTNREGPVVGLMFKPNGYVKKPVQVMQIEDLGKLTNVKKCNSFKK